MYKHKSSSTGNKNVNNGQVSQQVAAAELAKGVCVYVCERALSLDRRWLQQGWRNKAGPFSLTMGNAVNKDRGGEQEQTEHKSFTNKPVTRHSAGQV